MSGFGSKLLVFSLFVFALSADVGLCGVIRWGITKQTFGHGVNQFTMEFSWGPVFAGEDTTGSPNPAGGLRYQYATGRFEVSERMIDSYNAEFGTPNNNEITKDLRGPNKPATNITWNEAARFVNWLNTSRGYQPAYRFLSSQMTANPVLWTPLQGEQYNPENPLRNRLAVFVLPSEDEWYQAAYFGFIYGPYYDYPNESNTPPISVASGTTFNTAVYDQSFGQGPADVEEAGAYNSYKVAGMGGNVAEWQEDYWASTGHVVRGGSWIDPASVLSSSYRTAKASTHSSNTLGFRVVHLEPIPEPNSMTIAAGLVFSTWIARRRKK
jgi:hypothetical protein